MSVQRFCLAVIVVSSLLAHQCCLAKSDDQPIQCAIEVAVPDALAARPGKECWQRSDGELLLVGNELISAAIDRKSGLLREIHNRANGSKYPIESDQTGVVLRVNGAAPREWLADGHTEHQFDI